MKKTLATFMAAAMFCMALAGCSSSSSAASSTGASSGGSPSASTPAASSSKGTIAVVTKTMNNPFHVTYAESIKEQGEAAGYTVEIAGPDAETDADRQIGLIETFIQTGVDAIVVSACSSTAVVDVIDQANAAGIPVFMVDSGADGDGYVTYVATDNYAGGELAGEWIVENVGSGKGVILDGNSGNDATTKRCNGFKDAVNASGAAIEIVGQEYANCEISKGMEVTENFLTAHPDLTWIFCANDNMAIGAGQAVAAAGLRDQVTIIGFDGQPDAAQSILDGEIDATIAQKPATMGKLIFEAIESYLGGQTNFESFIDTGCDIVTADNASTYLEWQ